MRDKAIMRAIHVTDDIVVRLIVQYNPGGWHDYYEVEVSKQIRGVWVKHGVTAYREYEDALLAFEQKQRDIAAGIILGENNITGDARL